MPEMIGLQGCAALVAGAGDGIGAVAARALAGSGARVVLAGRLERPGDRIEAEGGTAFALPRDIGHGDDAAGTQIRVPATDMTLAGFDSVVGLRLRAAFALSRAVARRNSSCMREAQSKLQPLVKTSANGCS